VSVTGNSLRGLGAGRAAVRVAAAGEYVATGARRSWTSRPTRVSTVRNAQVAGTSQTPRLRDAEVGAAAGHAERAGDSIALTRRPEHRGGRRVAAQCTSGGCGWTPKPVSTASRLSTSPMPQTLDNP
jgi:hypothetical protein